MPLLKRSPVILSRCHSTAASIPKLVVGIRKEDPSRIWERRAPLTPDAVHHLLNSTGVDVLIQECERRAFCTSDYVKAGARVHKTLEPAHIVLGIKETPVDQVLTTPAISPWTRKPIPRTYLMFSHTIKGQPYNMQLLSKFLAAPSIPDPHSPPRLIDYELLTDDAGKRTVGFGWFAGVAGALETLVALSKALLQQGVASPFLHTPRPHTLPNLPAIRKAFRAVGDHIIEHGTPKSLGPFVIGLTGTGNVAQGVLSILTELPIVQVSVKDLPALVSNPGTDLRKVYLVHAKGSDYLARSDGTSNREDYYRNPSKYHSSFHTDLAPYLTTLVNAVGWSQGYPRLITNEQLPITLELARRVASASGNPLGRFVSVGDISCDVQGGLEFLTHTTTLCDPSYTSRPANLSSHLPGVQMMAVDILPTALPIDASTHFSNVLMPYLESLIADYKGSKRGELKGALNRATVAREGKLAEKHAWLGEKVEAWRASSIRKTQTTMRKQRILMLGSGMVAGPAISEICKRNDIELVVASNSLSGAESLTHRHENASAVFIDTADQVVVESMISQSDLVISLLPVSFHPAIAKLCIKQRKHLVTASYISPAMRDLDERALNSDVLLLNEIGLDPGIDHCSAISLLRRLHSQNKRVVSFTSFCGGVPAPESAEGIPLGYKFSWSPRGVLTAALNGSRFKLGGMNYEILGEKNLRSGFPNVPVSDVLKLEGIANRDSIPYVDTYGLGKLEELRTVLRGTLRYPGFSQLMDAFKSIGLLDTEAPFTIDDWSSLIRITLKRKLGIDIASNDLTSVLSAAKDVIPRATDIYQLQTALEYLSLVPSSSPAPPVPKFSATAIDHLANLLAQKLRYEPEERDLVILNHEIIARDVSGQEEVHSSSLITYGGSEASAMARCVGLPVAFAALNVLDGRVTARGVCGPGVEDNLWKGVLDGLEEVGLGMKETVRPNTSTSLTVESALKVGFRAP
ncbi:Saccharopine dehydrogenase-domain-containing protein [Thelephora terrestris]|uniref:Saccharopine dehydrogenase-domain-containing protein n=1 Tax=Thelephora terrestris TaxID=56493 RepID=A0A9P6LAP4_9AGAM|nr:Saccharopine dehydrogenase-domain-containing protein [Thelephora terrestris]